MAGVTDRIFREICLAHGATHAVTEMISAKAMHFGDKKTEQLAGLGESENTTSIQIFGREPHIMAEAAAFFSNQPRPPHAIDINMGCPVRKIAGSGQGSALMREPKLVGEIVFATVKVSKVPITVKIRAGWDDSGKNAVDVAKIAQDSGAAHVVVHGRTREQFYTGEPDLDIIAAVKQALTIPVIANGSIYCADSAQKMLEYTRCDGLMVARGAMGNPWIFSEISARLEGREYTPPTQETIIQTTLDHVAKLEQSSGEYALGLCRKHIAWYIKGMKNAAALRHSINTAANINNIRRILLSIV